MNEIKPVMPMIGNTFMGRMLKLWRSYHVNEANSNKMMRLWLGYEFRDLLDEKGMFPQRNFNELRQRLNYRSITDLLNYVKMCKSFGLIGTLQTPYPKAVFSPVWHQFESSDGPLMNEKEMMILVAESDQNSVSASEGFLNRPNITPLGNSGELPPERRGPIEAEIFEEKMRKKIVLDYFSFVEKQEDADHKSIMLSIRKDIRSRGLQLFQEKNFDEAFSEVHAEEVWQLMKSVILPDTFAKRELFFKDRFMKDPSSRVYWMKQYFTRYGKGTISQSIALWLRRRKSIEGQSAMRQREDEMNNHPLSPYEWTDLHGCRWYIDPDGDRLSIPQDAPPRPSDTASYSRIRGKWK